MAPHLFARFESILLAEVAALVREGVLPEGLETAGVTVEPPREAAHGDIACNVAMVLAKPARRNPREIAQLLAERLHGRHGIADAEVAGPGFLNLRLMPAAWHTELRAALEAADSFGAVDLGGGERVNVEYVSTNPTGPLHVGHCRGAVVGDALAGLLARAGYAVTREYYVNDAGAQVDALARSAHLRYREALGEPVGDIPSGLYPGDYLVPVGQALARQYGDRFRDAPEAEWLAPFRAAATAAMMDLIRADLALLGIRHEVFFSERSLTAGGRDRIAEAIAALRDLGLIYEGRLPPPKGQPIEDWEDREQTLFRSTRFDDDVDRPLMKSDGSYTYFASDIAYHFDKFARGFANMIDVWGADHAGYVKRMKAAVAAITEGRGVLDIKICQLVRLFRAGEPVKMSKRAGDFVTLRELVDEVGPDPVRFMMLYRKNDAPLDFDFARVTERSRDNPVFYVQYAHARTASVLRNAAADLPTIDLAGLAAAPLDRLADEDLPLIRQIVNFPRIIELSARHHEPHRLAFYLNDLASEFHALWNRGKELPQLRFIQLDDIDTSRARLALVRVVAYVLQSGLGVLGVSAPDEMK